MARSSVGVELAGVLTIASGEKSSTSLASYDYSMYRTIGITSADTELTGQVTVQVLQKGDFDKTDDASWSILQNDSRQDIRIGSQEAVNLLALPFPALRVQSTLAEDAERTFYVCGGVY